MVLVFHRMDACFFAGHLDILRITTTHVTIKPPYIIRLLWEDAAINVDALTGNRSVFSRR